MWCMLGDMNILEHEWEMCVIQDRACSIRAIKGYVVYVGRSDYVVEWMVNVCESRLGYVVCGALMNMQCDKMMYVVLNKFSSIFCC